MTLRITLDKKRKQYQSPIVSIYIQCLFNFIFFSLTVMNEKISNDESSYIKFINTNTLEYVQFFLQVSD